MHESVDHDLHVVRALIAAVDASAAPLDAFLGPGGAAHAQSRREAAAELRVEAGRLEADRAAAGLLELAHRVIDTLRGGEPAPASPTRSAQASGIEAQERELQARFDAARSDDRLSGPVRDAVLRAYDNVKPGQDAARQRWLAVQGEG